MTSRDDVVGRLTLASGHPWGPTRSGLTAEAVAMADELGDDQLAVDARLALAEARHRGNEEWKGLAPFVWLLARLDKRPDLFDADRLRRLGWAYERAVPAAADNPAVSIAQVRELEAGLRKFFRFLGGSTHAIHSGLLHAAIMLGLEEEAAAEAAALRSAGADDAGRAGRADHESRDPLREIEWANIHEDWETAVTAAAPVLDRRVEGDDQPYAVQSEALLPLLALGHSQAAWDAHVYSYRRLRYAPNVMSYLGKHLEYLALSGRAARGLRIMRGFVGRADEAQSARALMDLLSGAVLVLRESERDGRGAEPLDTGVPSVAAWCPGPGIGAGTPLNVARPLFEEWACRIAARYDARNGNAAVSSRLRKGLAREPFVDADAIVGRHARAGAGAVEPAQGAGPQDAGSQPVGRSRAADRVGPVEEVRSTRRSRRAEEAGRAQRGRRAEGLRSAGGARRGGLVALPEGAGPAEETQAHQDRSWNPDDTIIIERVLDPQASEAPGAGRPVEVSGAGWPEAAEAAEAAAKASEESQGPQSRPWSPDDTIIIESVREPEAPAEPGPAAGGRKPEEPPEASAEVRVLGRPGAAEEPEQTGDVEEILRSWGRPGGAGRAEPVPAEPTNLPDGIRQLEAPGAPAGPERAGSVGEPGSAGGSRRARGPAGTAPAPVVAASPAMGHDDGAPRPSAVEPLPFGDAPYPGVDLRAPSAVVDAGGLLRRLEIELRRPGRTLEHAFLITQAMRLGLMPDPEQVGPELVRAARSLRYTVADREGDYGRAIDELARLRAYLTGVAHPLRLIELDLEALQVGSKDDALHDRSTARTRADQLAHAKELAEQLTAMAEPLLDAPAGHQAELVDAYRSATAMVRVLSDHDDHQGAAEFLELARLVVPHVADFIEPHDGALDDQLTLLEAGAVLARGDARGAGALADAVLRRYDPCPVVLAVAGRSVLVRALMSLGETERAVAQSRDLLDIHMSVGLEALAGPLFGSLAASLGASGRLLEAAEVLETALATDVPPTLAEELRCTLISTMERLGEEEGVRDNCLVVAESALKRGEAERGADYLLRAASASEKLGETARASHMFERAAELVDTSDNAGRVRCARYLRRAGRAAVAESADLTTPVRPDKARALMSRAWDLIEAVPDSRKYSRAVELGDWHDDMAWILWRVGEHAEALDHCKRSFTCYVSAKDRGTAAHPLTLMALIHAEMGDSKAAREDIGRVRRLLGHQRWEGHPALERVTSLEEALDKAS